MSARGRWRSTAHASRAATGMPGSGSSGRTGPRIAFRCRTFASSTRARRTTATGTSTAPHGTSCGVSARSPRSGRNEDSASTTRADTGPGFPALRRAAKYPREGCGTKASLFLRTGVSVGWKDDYFWRIIGQKLDVTNLPNGRYRLINRVDPRNWFHESNDRNNTTWVDIEIGDRVVKVVGRSPRP